MGSVSIDTNYIENRKNHKTSKYHNQYLILRRGQHFDISCSSSDGNDLPSSPSNFILTIQDSVEKLSVRVPIEETQPSDDQLDDNKWNCWFVSKSASSFSVSISIAANAPVGVWWIELQFSDDTKIDFPNDPLIVFFNPWCKQDTVYMAEEEWLNEYILADDGAIWVGNQHRNSGRPWNFAQFNTKSMIACLGLLQNIPLQERKSPISVSRTFSALVNSSDEGGVLTGNWSGDYSGGKEPTSWQGSAEILKEYVDSDHSPVKYGQCWVFSGVLTTCMRCLGIPARSVTNFASAHDTGSFNRAVDKYFDEKGEADDGKTDDSIWNFHVWMQRPDLNEQYHNSGWQAIDATPQELSDNLYQTGPCPLEAIKRGDSNVDYDLEFIFSEVNADIVYHVKQSDGTYKETRKITNGVGKCISTKEMGSMQRNDVTLEYKHREGSLEERAAHGNSPAEGVGLDLRVNATPFGKPIVATLDIVKQQDASEAVSVQIRLAAKVVTYTGRLKEKDLPPLGVVNGSFPDVQSETLDITIPFEKYGSYLMQDDAFLEFTAFVIGFNPATPQDTWSTVLVSEFDVDPLSLDIDVVEPPILGGVGEVVCSFSNPLSVPLTNASLIVEGQGMTKTQQFQIGELSPGEKFEKKIEVKGWELGSHLFMATFLCTELKAIISHVPIVTVPGNKPPFEIRVPDSWFERLWKRFFLRR